MICEACFEDYLADFLKDICSSEITTDMHDGCKYDCCDIVGVWSDGEEKVKVKFGDGTEEIAVCSEDNIYELRRGIEVCILHKLFGGHENYNNVLNDIVKTYYEEKEKHRLEEEKKINFQASNTSEATTEKDRLNNLINALETIIESFN